MFEDFSDLENIPLMHIEWTFPRFVSMMTYLGYIFLIDVSIFTTVDDKKEEKVNSSSVFEGFYLKLRRRFWRLKNTNDSL